MRRESHLMSLWAGLLVAFSFVFVAANPTHAVLIFSDGFNGSGADLSGVAPEVRNGNQTWVASPNFNQNGTIDPNGAGSATLAFTPDQWSPVPDRCIFSECDRR